MTDHIYVEPGHKQRPAFAAWGLTQDPPLQTASATGWNVPLSLYVDVPTELLAGAYVDGLPYSVEQPQPRLAAEPVEPVDEPVEPVDEPVEPVDEPVEPVDEPVARTRSPLTAESKPRKRSAKKTAPGAYTRKPSDAETMAVASASDSGGGE